MRELLLTKTTSLRVVAWSLLATIVFLSIIPAAARPGTGSHNLEHIGIFLLTGFVFACAYPKRWTVTLALATFAAGVEAVQVFVPGRHARVSDLIVDVAGICAGAFLAIVSRTLRG
jgi:VanZ family protein